MILSRTLESVLMTDLKPNPRNARTHSPKQVRQVAASIKKFGFTNPVLVDEHMMILAGHGCVKGAKLRKHNKVPIYQTD